MKRTIIITAAIIISLSCIGTLQAFTALNEDEPQEIRGIIVDEHDSSWYETQQILWLKKAYANKKNEHAWQQAFEAARYVDMFAENYGRTQRKQTILDQMAQNIPDSYTYNLCMYMTEIAQHGSNPEQYAKKALKLMPENINRKDAEVLIAYLWMTGKTVEDNQCPNIEQQQLSTFAKKLYNTNAYPSYLLRYTYNSLQGMKDNAIYFVNGDVPGYTSLVLQKAIGVHTDKTIVPVSFLHVEAYRKALCNHLGIENFEMKKDYSSIENGAEVYFKDILEYIINKSNRPVYFFPSGSYPKSESFMKNLYNEGLVFHYSEKRYDNMAVAKQNVEKRYSLDYLTEPLFVNEEQWKGSERTQLNYMVMLAPVVKSYREEGDTLNATKLARYLSAAVMLTSLSAEEKQQYFNIMDTKQR